MKWNKNKINWGFHCSSHAECILKKHAKKSSSMGSDGIAQEIKCPFDVFNSLWFLALFKCPPFIPTLVSPVLSVKHNIFEQKTLLIGSRDYLKSCSTCSREFDLLFLSRLFAWCLHKAPRTGSIHNGYVDSENNETIVSSASPSGRFFRSCEGIHLSGDDAKCQFIGQSTEECQQRAQKFVDEKQIYALRITSKLCVCACIVQCALLSGQEARWVRCELNS